eukprot:scaffold1969_cov417-Prasinococcus_capsulatus_cf.AAC.1
MHSSAPAGQHSLDGLMSRRGDSCTIFPSARARIEAPVEPTSPPTGAWKGLVDCRPGKRMELAVTHRLPSRRLLGGSWPLRIVVGRRATKEGWPASLCSISADSYTNAQRTHSGDSGLSRTEYGNGGWFVLTG